MPRIPRRAVNAIVVVIAVLAGFGGADAIAQGRARWLDLASIDDPRAWKHANIEAKYGEMNGRRIAYLQSLADSANGIVGLALPNGVTFDTGTIELDLKGRSVRGRSFLGVAFNVIDERTFEAVYFRPFNFRAEAPYRGRAVQYISWPANTWEFLRKTFPGTFENAIDPAPDPDDWFHARIEVTSTQVRVFVGGAKEACLTVARLATGHVPRPMGLFVDSADGFYSNVKVTRGRP